MTTAELAIFVFLNEANHLQSIVGNLILLGFGFTLFSAPNTNAVMSSAPRVAYGAASATLTTMRQIGMVLSTGVIMLLFTFLIGRVEITPECCPLLEQSMKTSFIIFAALCLGGIFASLAKGKVCWSPLPVHFADDLNLSYEIP